jgi:tetratricopeptide (TPR) repeat protein
MKPLHLVGLRGANDQKLIFHPPERAPLVLTSLVPPMDQEQILGFYQQVLAPSGQLPRIEVEWGQSMLPTDRRFLQTMRERHGAQEVLVVVRVLRDQPMVDLNQILAQPELDAFQHVAISAVDPMRNESLVRLSELAQFVTEVAQERYEEIADELGLRQEAFHSIQHRLRVLLNPVDILEAVNALIDVQDEAKAIALASPRGHEGAGQDGPRPEEAKSTFEDQVVWRILSRVFHARPVEEQVLLAAFALDKQKLGAKLLGARWKSAHARLRAAQLIRNDELAGWATWLKEAKQEDLLRQAVSVHYARRRDEVRWIGQARKWFRDHQGRKRGGELHPRIVAVFDLINAGKYGRAKEELNTIEPLLSGREVSDTVRGDFWDALGRVKLSIGQATDGLEALQRAVDLLEKGQATATRRAATLTELASGLRDNRRWLEAEPLFREALRLAEEGGDTPTSRSITMAELASGLRDNRRWLEAEPLFREALRLAEEGSDTPTNRSITMAELARGLRDNGRWSEAEPLFREALRLAEEGGATSTSRAITMHALARGLLGNGRWSEAEPLLREASRLKEEGGATPTSRAITMHELASGLRDNGRWSEAEPLFREALRLAEEGGDTSTGRAITMDHLARGLRDNGRWSEAEPLFRNALRLKEEGGDTPTNRAITMHELARGLRDNGRWSEAEPLFRDAVRLAEEGGDTPTNRAITMHELARGLRDNGRWSEAEPLFRNALRLKEEGGDTPTSRAITMHALARGLLDNGRWPEAEPIFREALLLKRGDNTEPVSLAVTMDHLARGLRDHGFWVEAEPLFREALRLKEEARAKPKSIRETMDELARGLRANGREAEAKALVEQATQLV